jgi:serine phosphatase RsbU (regulator of sigma subunit)
MVKKNNTVSLLFQTAALQSERLRILGLLAALLFLMAFTFVRAVLSEASLQSLFWKTLPLLSGAIIYEVILLFLVLRARKRQHTLPGWLTILTVVLETSFPTLGLLIMTTQPELHPYSILSAPIVSIYFLFRILSALRLQQSLCILAGITASLGYFSVIIFVYLHWPNLQHEDLTLSLKAHVTYGVLILLGGLLAALVARKIRTEVSESVLQLEKSQRLEADLEVARSIQLGLLPQSKPQLAEYDISGHSWPADQTGGDYYDWLPLPDGRWAFTIADVSGHGIGPALVTANCHAYVHAVFGRDGDLLSWINRINHFLEDDLDSGRFVTFLAAVLEQDNNSVSILSAGHGPTLLYRSSTGSVEELSTQGPPLGVLADYTYDPPVMISLDPGDFLVLITDGFMEWANSQNEQFDVSRMKTSLQQHSSLTSTQIIDCLRGDVLAFASGTNQKDDLTAVVIKKVSRH